MGTLRLLILACLGLCGVARAAPPVEAYGHLPAVEFIRLSPAGDRYATMATIGNQRRLIVATTAGKVINGGEIGDRKIRDIIWAGDDHVMVELSTTFSAPVDFRQAMELATVVSKRISDNKTVAVFDKIPNIANAVFGYYGTGQVDGHVYGYFAGLTYGGGQFGADFGFVHGYTDLYQVDLDTAKLEKIAKGDELTQSWVVTPAGKLIAHSEYSDNTGTWRLFSGRDHQKPLFEKVSSFDDLSLRGQGRRDGTVLIYDDTNSGNRVTEIDLANGHREEIFTEVTVEGFLRDPDAGKLIGGLTVEEPYAFFFDSTLQARYNAARKAFPGLQMQLESFSRNLDRLIVMTDGRDDAGTFWLVDIASGKADPIGVAYPKIRAADVAPTSSFRYKAADGLEIEAVLTLPPGKKAEKLPVVIMPHGGPIGIADRIGFDWWAQAYASAGYAVLQPNYRGSGGYGPKIREAGMGEWGRKMQTDLSDGLAALAAQGVVDAKRACIVGASYGGYAALAGVTIQHGIYRCAVSVSGPADLVTFFRWQMARHGKMSPATRYWLAVTGAEKAGDEALRSISPAAFAEQADAPVLLVHGKDDTVVPIEQSEQMAAALKSAHKPVEFVTMKGEDHWLSNEDTRTAMLKAAVAFVRQQNPVE